MCWPIIIAGVGAVIAGVGQYQQGKYQEQVAKNNEVIEKGKARDAIIRAETDVQLQQQQAAATKGSTRAALAASGVDVNSGSAANVQADIAQAAALDSLTIRSNAIREGYGHRVQAVNDRASGKLARQSGNYGAVTTVLGGLSKAFSEA